MNKSIDQPSVASQILLILLRPVPLIVGAVLTAAAYFIADAIQGESRYGIGAAIVVAVTLLAYAVIAAIARRDRAFFRAYAKARGLTYVEGNVTLPFTFLRRGATDYAEQTLVGRLPGGLEGVLARWTYEVTRYVDPETGQESSYEQKFTVVTAELPRVAGLIGGLRVRSRAEVSPLESSNLITEGAVRVTTESARFEERYEAYAGSEPERNTALQILSPTFVEWLAERPGEISFALDETTLICARAGHIRGADELDELAEGASKIAERLTAEASEEPSAASARTVDLGLLTETSWPSSTRAVGRYVFATLAIFFAGGAGMLFYLENSGGTQDEDVARYKRERTVELEAEKTNLLEERGRLEERLANFPRASARSAIETQIENIDEELERIEELFERFAPER